MPPDELSAWLGQRVGDRWPATVEPAAFESGPPDAGGPGLTLAPLEAAATLAACAPREGDPDFRSASLRFWSLASRFLLGLLSRGRFRPTVDRNGSHGAALWQADLGSQQRELDALRLAAPPAALGGLDAETAISGYLVALGDSVIRDAGRRLGWSPGAVDAPGGRREVIERVLDDLFSGASGGLDGESAEALWRVDSALGGGLADPDAGAVGSARLVFLLEPPADEPETEPFATDPMRSGGGSASGS